MASPNAHYLLAEKKKMLLANPAPLSLLTAALTTVAFFHTASA